MLTYSHETRKRLSTSLTGATLAPSCYLHQSFTTALEARPEILSRTLVCQDCAKPGRPLSSVCKERDISLIGDALWAAKRALETRRKAADGNPWLFPRYSSDKEIKATHASNTLNKWLRSLDGVSNDKTTHCFRHAMRDRLRAVQVPHDIQETIGGWGTRTIGQGYGNGYPLQILTEHMRKVVPS